MCCIELRGPSDFRGAEVSYVSRMIVFCILFLVVLVLPTYAQKPELVVETGHTDAVNSISFSPDGRFMASASDDDTVKVWEVAGGRELRTLKGHTDRVWSVSFSRDGRMLVSAGDDGTAKLWDPQTGRLLWTINVPDGNSVFFSLDGRTLVSGSADGTVRLWSSATGGLLKTMSNPRGKMQGVVLTTDGKELVSDNGTIWDLTSGRVLPSLYRNTSDAELISGISPDGHTLVAGGEDGVIKLWDLATGRLLRTLVGHKGPISSVAFSPNGQVLATANLRADGAMFKECCSEVKLWDPATGRLLQTFRGGESDDIKYIVFSPDGRIVASGNYAGTFRLWEATTGHELGKGGFAGAPGTFSHDGRLLASAGDHGKITIWDLANLQAMQTLGRHTLAVDRIALNLHGDMIALDPDDGKIRLWDLSTGRESQELTNNSGDLYFSLTFSSDGRSLVSQGSDEASFSWDITTGHEMQARPGKPDLANNELGLQSRNCDIGLGPNGPVHSADGRVFAWGDVDCKIRLWDGSTGRELSPLSGYARGLASFALSPDGKTVVATTIDDAIWMWDVKSGKPIGMTSLKPPPDPKNPWDSSIVRIISLFIAFSPDSKTVAFAWPGNVIALWDVANAHEVIQLQSDKTSSAYTVAFSPDGHMLASGNSDHTIKLWEIPSGRELRVLKGDGPPQEVKFSPDGRFIISRLDNGAVDFWEVASGRHLAGLYSFDHNEWAVIDPAGRFDASPGGMKLMHWAVGNQMISLGQLKERYYDPGLLAKVLGFNKEPARNVNAFTDVKLFPEITYDPPAVGSNSLQVHLKNQGGGIGKVQVFVNGKESLSDARPPGMDPQAAEATLTADLSNSHFKPGEENEIEVVSWNREGYLSSERVIAKWTPQGRRNASPPELYALVAGISDYSSPNLQLEFAANDAQSFAKALQLGAGRLFGPEHVHVTLLSTANAAPDRQPNKANIQKAFEAARQSKPSDVFVVYLAGHGVAIQDIYAYPTSEARTLDLADPAIREKTAITSEELANWIKAIPALHQVMILDTCAAGAAEAKLAEKRDVPGDQIRAIDRLKDRTGFYVLMGSAANAVSYEASQYGQGLLTYSLLEGMRGAALRDEKFVDVSKLFEYAADKVPQLAMNVGGVQRPQIVEPWGGSSFDMGALETPDKQAIPLAIVKPLILRPLLLNLSEGTDNLQLVKALEEHLRASSYVSDRGVSIQPKTVFVDQDEFPGAIRPTGFYSIENGQVKIKVVLSRDGKKISENEVDGSAQNLADLIEKISATITKVALDLQDVSHQ